MVAWVLATGLQFGPAAAAQHEASKIILPDHVGDMAIDVGAAGNFGDLARQYTFQNGADRVEIRIVKSAHPNVGIWFRDAQWNAERLLAAGHPTLSAVSIRTVSSNVPNAITAEFAFSAHYQSAAVAVVGFGDWVVSILSVSKAMAPAEQRSRLDAIIAQIHTPSLQKTYPRVAVINQCKADIPPIYYFVAPQKLDTTANMEEAVVASLLAKQSSDASRLKLVNAIANAPDAYCWVSSESGKTKWFRSTAKDASLTWLTTLSWGWTIEAWAMPPVGKASTYGTAIIVNDFNRTKVAGLFRQAPYPPLVLAEAMVQALAPSRIAFVDRDRGAVTVVGSD
jgi:hypothetical protein